ncbi:ABC transporter ATP-binding protein [Actinoplanes sp. NPDC048791]|uniref:ABC transporter ATP-binding protein n=1 Tax=Actinoplanes sp. NPDC048791 TaxID=3154623 RepID=UPI0033CC3250
MNPVICRDVHLSYGSYQAVRGADLEVRPGELVALIGTNGAGKSTLLDAMLGLRRPDAGTVRVLSLDPYRSRRRLAPDVGVVLQEGGCAPDLTVAETVRLWLGLHRRLPMTHVEALIDEVHLEHRAGVRVRRLSGGERRRLDLAVALCSEPKLLLLDEPTSGLDPEARLHTWDVLRCRLLRGATVVMTTHHLEEAETLADRVAVLHRGVVTMANPRVPGLVKHLVHGSTHR